MLNLFLVLVFFAMSASSVIQWSGSFTMPGSLLMIHSPRNCTTSWNSMISIDGNIMASLSKGNTTLSPTDFNWTILCQDESCAYNVDWRLECAPVPTLPQPKPSKFVTIASISFFSLVLISLMQHVFGSAKPNEVPPKKNRPVLLAQQVHRAQLATCLCLPIRS